MKQSVKGTLKVMGKSLKTALDEVHFVVNLYSFILSPVAQADPSFPKVSHFPPPRQSNFQNSPFSRASVIALVCIFFSNLSHR